MIQFFASSLEDCLLILIGPAFMEKSCPWKEDHPPGQFNVNERLYEKPFDLFAWSKSW